MPGINTLSPTSIIFSTSISNDVTTSIITPSFIITIPSLSPSGIIILLLFMAISNTGKILI